MIWTVIVLLLLFWVVGFAFDVFGGFIHLLLLAAVVVFILNLVGGRRKIAG
jgi:predicted membrane metal-binding protein